MNNGADCGFNLTSDLIITWTSNLSYCDPSSNLEFTNYSYINIGTNCTVSCINESNSEWK